MIKQFKLRLQRDENGGMGLMGRRQRQFCIQFNGDELQATVRFTYLLSQEYSNYVIYSLDSSFILNFEKRSDMQEQTIPQAKKFLNEKTDKQYQITMQLIGQTSLDEKLKQSINEQDKINVLIRLKSIHLQWLNIKKIENLDVFQDLNVLYLQHNRILRIQGLENLKNLEYLALNDNRITKLENVKCLKKLLGLNLNNNDIEELDQNQLPQNLQLLSFKNNPVCLDVDYKQKILKKIASLQVLDDQNITPAERFKILGVFPQKLLTYANQMRQFYTKRQIQSKLDEENKAVLFNTEAINEKQALSQIRQKTRKYIYQNQQTFKKELKQQMQDFNEKLQVSKKIRSIKQKEQAQRQRRLTQIKDSAMNDLMNKFTK